MITIAGLIERYGFCNWQVGEVVIERDKIIAGIKLAYALQLVHAARFHPRTATLTSREGKIEMSYAKISEAECQAIHLLRTYAPNDARKHAKKEIFAKAKAAYGIPSDHKMTVEVDLAKPDAGVLKNRVTRQTYELGGDGKWVHAAAAAAAAKRWFKLPVANLFDTIHEGIDSIDNIGGSVVGQQQKPAHTLAFNIETGEAVLVASNGDVWIQLDADAFETTASSTADEEDDDLPY